MTQLSWTAEEEASEAQRHVPKQLVYVLQPNVGGKTYPNIYLFNSLCSDARVMDFTVFLEKLCQNPQVPVTLPFHGKCIALLER